MISFFKRKYVCAVIFSVVLISFTLFMVLDTFVIEKIYQTVPPINQETSETESGSEGKQSDTKPEKMTAKTKMKVSRKIAVLFLLKTHIRMKTSVLQSPPTENTILKYMWQI